MRLRGRRDAETLWCPDFERQGAAPPRPFSSSRASCQGQKPSGPRGSPATGDPRPAEQRGPRQCSTTSTLPRSVPQRGPESPRLQQGSDPTEGRDLVQGGREDRGGKPPDKESLITYKRHTKPYATFFHVSANGHDKRKQNTKGGGPPFIMCAM